VLTPDDEVDWNWVPDFGVHFHLAVDGLSLLMLVLTFLLGIMAVLASWTEILKKVGSFHFNLMWLGFFVAFTVKLPVAPLHTWLPDAHTEAPTAGSVILAGLLLKLAPTG
jgi:NADH:ubiquinone oxidoreductase subunit 4 (subunit M)